MIHADPGNRLGSGWTDLHHNGYAEKSFIIVVQCCTELIRALQNDSYGVGQPYRHNLTLSYYNTVLTATLDAGREPHYFRPARNILGGAEWQAAKQAHYTPGAMGSFIVRRKTVSKTKQHTGDFFLVLHSSYILLKTHFMLQYLPAYFHTEVKDA